MFALFMLTSTCLSLDAQVAGNILTIVRASALGSGLGYVLGSTLPWEA